MRISQNTMIVIVILILRGMRISKPSLKEKKTLSVCKYCVRSGLAVFTEIGVGGGKSCLDFKNIIICDRSRKSNIFFQENNFSRIRLLREISGI